MMATNKSSIVITSSTIAQRYPDAWDPCRYAPALEFLMKANVSAKIVVLLISVLYVCVPTDINQQCAIYIPCLLACELSADWFLSVLIQANLSDSKALDSVVISDKDREGILCGYV